MTKKECASHHYGPWAIEPNWLMQEVSAIQSGVVQPDKNRDPNTTAEIINGVAVIPIAGPMMKIRSKFGGTSTVDVRTMIRKAVQDESVSAILLHIDSPGGTVAGTEALAQDIADADEQKPVYAHIEDLGASAAYYVACQARRITASKGSLVGSLGVRMTVVDSSQGANMQGLKVYDISTGPYKGTGTEGTPITEKQLAYLQEIVNSANVHFKNAVMDGRGFDEQTTDTLFDGRVHDAEQAQILGLIDDVSTLETAMAAISTEVHNMKLEQAEQFAAENPEFTAKYVEHGKKAGMAEAYASEKTRMQEIATVFGEENNPAVKSFLAGQDSATAGLVAQAAKDATAKAQEQLTAAQAEIEKLKAQQGTQGAIGISPAKQEETVAADPKAAAKAEWDKMSDGEREAWASEALFVRVRAKELGLKK